MNERDVYNEEMLTRKISDHDVERILAGQDPEDADLTSLARALSALHAYEADPSDDTVARLAAEAASAARAARPKAPSTDIAPTAQRWRVAAMREKLALVAASAVVVIGMTGVAAASDAAAPGDVLYGLDRALESIGINHGGTGERISEAQDLAGEGRVSEAINHVATAVEATDQERPDADFSPESAAAASALRDAAEDVETEETAPSSQEVRDAVAAMLEEMADMLGNPDFDGSEFGQRVSEMARSIGAGNRGGGSPDQQPPDDAGPPQSDDSEPQGGPPPDAPGPPEDAPGPPDDTPGPPENTPGPPENTPGPPGGGRP